MENTINLNTLIAIFITVIGAIIQYFLFITRLQIKISRLETKTELFWKAIENNVVNMLKSYPTNISKDVLLDKLLHKDLTLDDACHLRTILKEEIKQSKENLVLIYAFTLGRIEQIIYDIKSGNDKQC